VAVHIVRGASQDERRQRRAAAGQADRSAGSRS